MHTNPAAPPAQAANVLDPNDLGFVATLYHTGGQHQQALETYRKIAELPNHHPNVHYNIAIQLRALARHQEALSSLTTYLRAVPQDFKAWRNAGDSLRELGNHRGALAMFREELRTAPTPLDQAAAHHNISRSQWIVGPFADALANARRAHDLDPSNPVYTMTLGELEMVNGEFEKGWPHYDERLVDMAKKRLNGECAPGWPYRDARLLATVANKLPAAITAEEAVDEYEKLSAGCATQVVAIPGLTT